MIQADVGEVGIAEAVADGLYRFEYRPARLEQASQTHLRVSLPGGRAHEKELPVCPAPAGQILISAKPNHLLAGQDQHSQLDIQVFDSRGAPVAGAPITLSVNTGILHAVEDLGQGRYRASYVPPSDAFPQVAIIMAANPAGARLDRVAVGRVVIPITARIDLPGKTAPGTRMRMVVAGRSFGPVQADRSGQFNLPILVPPGYGKGQATSIDRVGNRKTRWVDLFLPETNQLGLWAYPTRLPADGRSKSRLLLTTIDRYGKPSDVGQVLLRAERGQLSPLLHLAEGLYESYYTAAGSVADGRDRIRVRFPEGGGKSHASAEIDLLPGPAQRLALRVPELLAADSSSRGLIEVEVTDRRGNPVAGQPVALACSEGKVVDLEESRPGFHTAALVVDRDPQCWDSRIEARVEDRPGGAPDRILVCQQSLDEGLDAVVVDPLGLPSSGQPVMMECDKAQPSTAASNRLGRVRFDLALGGSAPVTCLLHTSSGRVRKQIHLLPGSDREPARLLPIDLDIDLPPDAPPSALVDVPLHPPLAVALHLRVSPPARGQDSYRLVVEVTGEPGGPEPRIDLSASCGKLSPLHREASGRYAGEWRPPAPGWVRAVLTAVERSSHVGVVETLIEREGQEP
ncbi:MAG: hypothetical protein JXR96_31200 [Deltaproteobacteria bacterium]|nr:hypothetical protein [Deltaproteobacteria bacterium]